MSISLATKFAPYTDEQFKAESKLSLITNKEFDWTGAHTVKVYKVSTATMNDYGRTGPAEGNWSRYGSIADLGATTEEFTLKKDRSFIFNVDKLDTDETAQQVQAASALARQNREVIIPEIDSYVYGVMAAGAGTKATAKALAATSIYADILDASKALDDAEIPETSRVLIVSPATYQLMKKADDIILNTEIGEDMRLHGVIANLDGVLLESSSEVYQGVADGRFTVGLTFEEGAAHYVAEGQPVKIVYMEEGVISRPDVVAIVKGTIHEAEAEQFVDFVTGLDAQQTISSQLDRRTVRLDVEEPSYLPDKGQLHIIWDDEELSGQKKALWLERFAGLYEKSVTAP